MAGAPNVSLGSNTSGNFIRKNKPQVNVPNMGSCFMANNEQTTLTKTQRERSIFC